MEAMAVMASTLPRWIYKKKEIKKWWVSQDNLMMKDPAKQRYITLLHGDSMIYGNRLQT